MTLSGRHVVVIGASSGMGLATARMAANAGARVTLVARGSARLQEALNGLPGTCEAVAADIANAGDMADLFTHRVEPVDHLVITAGEAPAPRPFLDTTPEQMRQLFDARVGSVITAIKHAVARMPPTGSISVTSGSVAVRPTPGSSLSTCAATAIEGLARALAVELAPIRVNVVRPGVTRTPMWDTLPADQREAVFATLAKRTLTGSLATADEIAAAHLYLLQNHSVTGTVLTVDGGSLLV